MTEKKKKEKKEKKKKKKKKGKMSILGWIVPEMATRWLCPTGRATCSENIIYPIPLTKG